MVFELDEEAFFEVSGEDSGGFTSLEEREYVQDLFVGASEGFCDFEGTVGEPPCVIDEVDEVFCDDEV